MKHPWEDSAKEVQDGLERMRQRDFEQMQDQAAKTMDLHKAIQDGNRRMLGHSEFICEALLESIASFEDTLDEEHETGAHLAAFGRQVTIRITDVHYREPYVIVFGGFLEGGSGERVQLVQHSSQLNLLLLALPKPADQPVARRIGFDVD